MQHGRHQRDVCARRHPAHVVVRVQAEAVEHRDRRAEHDVTHQDEHAADVRGREATHPRLRRFERDAARRRTERGERQTHRRGHGRSRQLHELRPAGRAGCRHDEPDAIGLGRRGIGEQHLVVGGDDRCGAREVHDRPPLTSGETGVERKDRRPRLPQFGDHVQPGGPRRQVDRDQEPRRGAQVPAHVR
jgi:hypothetical protein